VDLLSISVPEDPTNLELVGLKEFQIAKALLDGHAAKLSQRIPSQWGDVHLFDVCLFLGFADTAWALVRYGVEGCQVEMHHLGPFGTIKGPGDVTFLSEPYCWGFPVDRGTWMPGWNCHIQDAVEAAEKVARKLWFPDLLDMVCSEQKLGFAVSAEAMARLLDIAILAGNKEAARVLHGKCALLPLRRWYPAFFINCKEYPFAIPILRAALAVGIDFSELSVCFCDDQIEWIPFSQALFLLSTSLWMELCGFLPPSPWRPEHKNNLARYFLLRRDAQERPDSDDLNRFKLDTKKLQNAGKAEVDLRCLRMELRCVRHSQSFLSLLDLAIVWGQPDCAEICASMDMELTDFGRQSCWDALYCVSADFRAFYFYSRPRTHPLVAASPDACMDAARSAAISALRVAHKRHVTEKGFVLYQTLLKRFDPSPFPLWILDEILALSVRAPTIIEQLQLWEGVAGWDTEIKSQDMEADGGKAEVSTEQTALKSRGQQSGASLWQCFQRRGLSMLTGEHNV